jgi:hypothetical protein
MRVEAITVSKGRGGQALEPLSLAYESGRARLATAETEQRPTVLGLIASGRMRPDTGVVLIGGAEDNSAVRRKVALVDAPDVSDPAPNVTVFTVVAEELMFAGRPSNPIATKAWLGEAGLLPISRTPIADVAPADRLRMLLELSVLRPDVEALVLVSPDRHGGDPHVWWELAEEFAGRGLAVLVIAGQAAGAVLAGRAARAEMDETEVAR